MLLVVWGAGLIIPEFARVATNYGTLGFEADNDGVISAVKGPPATDQGIHPGDCISLRKSSIHDLIAVFGSMGGMTYVRPDLEVTLYVAPGSCADVATRATRRVLKAREAPMTATNRITLAADQILGLFFICQNRTLAFPQRLLSEDSNLAATRAEAPAK